MTKIVTIDFETRSAANLLKTGAWRYSIDSSTQVLCLAYRFDDEEEIYLWHREIKPHFALPGSNFFLPESPKPTKLLKAIEEGCLVEAHNSMFERCIWSNTLLREHPDWPQIKHRQYRCSAARAAILGLPRSLENLAHVLLKGIEKDKEGHRLMLQMSKPRKPVKAEKAFAKELGFEVVETVNKHILVNGKFLWWEDEARCKRLFAYCKQDVLVEHACSQKLPELSPYELEIFLMDQHINTHGIVLDLEYITIALKLIDTTVSRLNGQLRALTKDKVQSATSRDKVLKFLNEDLAYFLPNLTKEVLEEELEKEDLPKEVKNIIQIRQDVCRTSNAKYKAMMLMIDLSDNRVRNTILYSGAASTGRWSGTGLQPHNFPRGSIKGDMMNLCGAVAQFYLKPEVLEILFDNIMSLLSTTLRGAIIPPKNKDLMVADYSGIEARILLWIADDQEGLEVFRQGRDIYIDMACSIYNITYKILAKLVSQDKDEGKRFFGKQAILGLGYQMGKDKFYETILKYGIKNVSKDFLGNIIQIYRYEKYSKVSQLWNDTNNYAKEALQNRGKIVEQKINSKMSLKWLSHGHFLYCVLPSGRRLHYYHPKLKLMTTSWGEQRYCVTYMSTNAVTRKWERTHTYGGKLIENIVQAIARDLMANGMYNVYNSGIYFPVMTVHDELISEVDEGVGSLEHYMELLCKLPNWAEGLPLTADGWRGKRYHK